MTNLPTEVTGTVSHLALCDGDVVHCTTLAAYPSALGRVDDARNTGSGGSVHDRHCGWKSAGL